MKKFCWKCGKMSHFEKTSIKYVAEKTGGYQYTCKKCNDAYKKEHNIKEVIRINKESTGSMFNDFKFVYKDSK